MFFLLLFYQVANLYSLFSLCPEWKTLMLGRIVFFACPVILSQFCSYVLSLLWLLEQLKKGPPIYFTVLWTKNSPFCFIPPGCNIPYLIEGTPLLRTILFIRVWCMSFSSRSLFILVYCTIGFILHFQPLIAK